MDILDYGKLADTCIRGKKPPCSCACPLNLDVRAIAEAAASGNFTAAYRKLREKAVFPAIVCEICAEPCKNGCVRTAADDPLELKLLEKACVDFTESAAPPRYNLPKRKAKIAIIGAGIAGLTCALRLGTKSYDVTIYEASEEIGGRLSTLLDKDIYLKEIETQMAYARCEIKLGKRIEALGTLEADAVLIATGEGGETFGLDVQSQSFETQQTGVFIAGAVLGAAPVYDMAQAEVASHSIEKYIKIKKTDGVPESFIETESCITKDARDIEKKRAVMPRGGGYTPQEAQEEAARCLLCDCHACSDACEFFGESIKPPRLLITSAVTSLQSAAGLNRMTATQMMSSCNLCGLCKKLCPQGIDMGAIMRDFRYFKARDDKYPAAYHEYFLRDMQFANNDAAVIKAPPCGGDAEYLFFPGCQLAGGDPRYITKTYEHLLGKNGKTAIMLHCCGAPADWGGDKELYEQTVSAIREAWESLGRPVFIFACETCRAQITRALPQLEAVSLYSMLDGAPGKLSGEYCVFDPCAARDDEQAREAVRSAALEMGAKLNELKYSGELAQCCGFGGHIQKANRSLYAKIAKNRSDASQKPYITYCTNCRDTFRYKDKECIHILDAAFDLNNAEYIPPMPSERRKNRIEAKDALLNEFFGEERPQREEKHLLKLVIPPDMRRKMTEKLVLDEEAEQAVAYCEETGNKLFDKEKERFIGHMRIGIVTFWVEYHKDGEAYVLDNIYTHRVEIVGLK